MRRFLPFALKAAISLLLLYLALDFIKLETLRERLAQIEPAWIAAAQLTLALQIILVALRWQQIAERCGAELSGKRALLYTLIGTFFNQALPSTVGGDAARVWLLARETGIWKSALYSVLVDRVAGLFWLALLVLLCLPWSLVLIQSPIGRTTLILIGVGSVAGPFTLFVLTHTGRVWLNRWRVTRHLADVASIAWKTLVSIPLGAAVAAFSVAVHLLTVLVAWFCAKAVGSPIDLLHLLLLIPPVILIAAIPVSIAGWGVREGAMVAAFTFAGLSDSDALMISVLFGAGSFIIGALGGVAWILSGLRVRMASLHGGAPPAAP
jgi:uncharacterized membrane protein YbhN (UPF0104 family)